MLSKISTFYTLLFCLFSSHSFASLMVFDDHAAFQGAVSAGSGITLDFEPGVNPFDYFSLDYQDDYGPSTGVIDSGFNTTSGTSYLGLDIGLGFLAGADFTLSFNQVWHAIGFYLIASDELWDADVTLMAGAGSVSNLASTTTTLSEGGQATFVGIVDSNGFNSAQLFTYLDAFVGQGVFEFNIDDLQLVSFAGPNVPVPAPPALALLVLAALMTLRLGRKAK